MTELSLKDRIARYVRNNGGWVSGGEIERLVVHHTSYKASNASRRCREMESGKLANGGTCPILFEKKEERGTVFYKWNPRESETEKIISSIPQSIKTFDDMGGPRDAMDYYSMMDD